MEGQWDSEGYWNAVFGWMTPAEVMLEVEWLGMTPQDYARLCAEDACEEGGGDMPSGWTDACVRNLCAQLGVEGG